MLAAIHAFQKKGTRLMPISVTCAAWGKRPKAKDEGAGNVLPCPNCKQIGGEGLRTRFLPSTPEGREPKGVRSFAARVVTCRDMS